MAELHFTIRKADRDDYPDIVTIGRGATADYGLTVEDLDHGDRTRRPDTISAKLVAVDASNQIIGVSTYGQSAPEKDPGKYNVWVFVPPHLQGKAIGKRLYEQM